MDRKDRVQITLLVQPADTINLVFIAFLLVLSIAFSRRVQNPDILIALYGTMLMAASCLIWFVRSDSRPILRILRWWYPLAFVILAFFSLGWIVHHILPYDIDPELIALDLAMFGQHPTVLLSRFADPYAVDILSLCYASFYFLPVILGIVLYRKRKMREFEVFAAIVCLGFYLSDIGNLLFPARGPSQTLVGAHTVPLVGEWVGDVIRTILYIAEPYRWDCFPSGHVTVTLITLALCFRFERRVFRWMLPVGVGLIFSTVYLRYHYVIDVLAGALLATLILIGTEVVQKMWLRIRQPELQKLSSIPIYSADKDIS